MHCRHQRKGWDKRTAVQLPSAYLGTWVRYEYAKIKTGNSWPHEGRVIALNATLFRLYGAYWNSNDIENRVIVLY